MTSLSGDAQSITTPGKLFLGGISWETSEDGLREHFSKFGKIIDCVLMSDPQTNRPRGFGFVTFEDPESAIEASKEHYQMIDGRRVEVKNAVPKEAMTSKIRTKKVFVGGIPWTVNDEMMQSYFAQFGTIAEAQIIRDHASGKSRGFGYVTFEDEEIVDQVVDMPHTLGDKKVDVKKAVPKGTAVSKQRRSTPVQQPSPTTGIQQPTEFSLLEAQYTPHTLTHQGSGALMQGQQPGSTLQMLGPMASQMTISMGQMQPQQQPPQQQQQQQQQQAMGMMHVSQQQMLLAQQIQVPGSRFSGVQGSMFMNMPGDSYGPNEGYKSQQEFFGYTGAGPSGNNSFMPMQQGSQHQQMHMQQPPPQMQLHTQSLALGQFTDSSNFGSGQGYAAQMVYGGQQGAGNDIYGGQVYDDQGFHQGMQQQQQQQQQQLQMQGQMQAQMQGQQQFQSGPPPPPQPQQQQYQQQYSQAILQQHNPGNASAFVNNGGGYSQGNPGFASTGNYGGMNNSGSYGGGNPGNFNGNPITSNYGSPTTTYVTNSVPSFSQGPNFVGGNSAGPGFVSSGNSGAFAGSGSFAPGNSFGQGGGNNSAFNTTNYASQNTPGNFVAGGGYASVSTNAPRNGSFSGNSGYGGNLGGGGGGGGGGGASYAANGSSYNSFDGGMLNKMNSLHLDERIAVGSPGRTSLGSPNLDLLHHMPNTLTKTVLPGSAAAVVGSPHGVRRRIDSTPLARREIRSDFEQSGLGQRQRLASASPIIGRRGNNGSPIGSPIGVRRTNEGNSPLVAQRTIESSSPLGVRRITKESIGSSPLAHSNSIDLGQYHSPILHRMPAQDSGVGNWD